MRLQYFRDLHDLRDLRTGFPSFHQRRAKVRCGEIIASAKSLPFRRWSPFPVATCAPFFYIAGVLHNCPATAETEKDGSHISRHSRSADVHLINREKPNLIASQQGALHLKTNAKASQVCYTVESWCFKPCLVRTPPVRERSGTDYLHDGAVVSYFHYSTCCVCGGQAEILCDSRYPPCFPPAIRFPPTLRHFRRRRIKILFDHRRGLHFGE